MRRQENKQWFPKGTLIAILGAGESGIGAALLAQIKEYDVFVSDKGKIKQAYKEELKKHTIPFEEGEHTIEKIKQAEIIIKSPGIPDKIPLIQDLKKEGKLVISEIEFAAKNTSAKLIAISGSNGKTTTTSLTHHLLKTAGLNVDVGGNIGKSFARLLAENLQTQEKIQRDYYVLELSSFQLDGIVDFRPYIAILLNITPDHLDRYDYKMEKYIDSKFRIIQNQTVDDIFIFNEEDKNILQAMEKRNIVQQTIPIGKALFQNGTIDMPQQLSISMEKCSLKGQHNLFNASCAIAVTQSLGVSNEVIQKGINSFQNVPHRLELVATIDEVDYINDSKATNVDAVYYALQAMEKPIIWIAGGIDKGNDYSQIEVFVRDKVKVLICLGADNSKLLDYFSPIVKIIEETKSAKEAVERASIYAEQGDVVILSPACSSFDLFNNYMARGDEFKAEVEKLKE